MVQQSQLSELKSRVDTWRKAKQFRSQQMPQELQEAIEGAAKIYGVGKICRLLSLNSTILKKQISSETRLPTKKPNRSHRRAPANLVRIAPIAISESFLTAPAVYATWESASGHKLTFYSPIDPATLCALVSAAGGSK